MKFKKDFCTHFFNLPFPFPVYIAELKQYLQIFSNYLIKGFLYFQSKINQIILFNGRYFFCAIVFRTIAVYLAASSTMHP